MILRDTCYLFWMKPRTPAATASVQSNTSAGRDERLWEDGALVRKCSMFLRNLPRFCRSVSTATSQRQGQGMAHAEGLVGPSVFLTSLVVMSAPNSALNRSCSSAGLRNTDTSHDTIRHLKSELRHTSQLRSLAPSRQTSPLQPGTAHLSALDTAADRGGSERTVT